MAYRVCMTTRVMQLRMEANRGTLSKAAPGPSSCCLTTFQSTLLWGLAPPKLCSLIAILSNTEPLSHNWMRLFTVTQTPGERQPLAFVYTAPH